MITENHYCQVEAFKYFLTDFKMQILKLLILFKLLKKTIKFLMLLSGLPKPSNCCSKGAANACFLSSCLMIQFLVE